MPLSPNKYHFGIGALVLLLVGVEFKSGNDLVGVDQARNLRVNLNVTVNSNVANTVGDAKDANKLVVRGDETHSDDKTSEEQAVEEIQRTTTEDATPSPAVQPEVEPNTEEAASDPGATLKDEDDVFNPSTTIQDYERLQDHSPPSSSWLEHCVAALELNETVYRPFVAVRPDYRLGDCIRLCDYCNNTIVDKQSGQYKSTNLTYTATIAGLYGQWACPPNVYNPKRRKENFTVVDRIFEFLEQQGRPGFVQPEPNAVVIHLRLGDVLDLAWDNTSQLLIQGGIGDHPDSRNTELKTIFSVQDYIDILDGLEEGSGEAISKVYLVGGSHKPRIFQKSKVYAHCLQRGLAKAGKKVELQIEGNEPDQDFYFMSHAKRLMLSTGGFSRMMGQMAVRNEGELVGPDLVTPTKTRKRCNLWKKPAFSTCPPGRGARTEETE